MTFQTIVETMAGHDINTFNNSKRSPHCRRITPIETQENE